MKEVIMFIVLLTSMVNSGMTQELPINSVFTNDTIFNPFENLNKPISSLKIDGSIRLFSDTSLVRIVAITHEGDELLVFESYPLIVNDTIIYIFEASEETAYMTLTFFENLKIQVINASLALETLKYDLNQIENAEELAQDNKIFYDSVKISALNANMQKYHLYWRAGQTNYSQMSYAGKVQYFGDKHNLQGFDFWLHGIFHRIHDVFTPSTNSNLPEEFDWRNRHNANSKPDNDQAHPYYNALFPTTQNETGWGWITQESHGQGSDNTCFAFAGTGLAECYANLYFNNNVGINNQGYAVQHQVNIDLSEEQLVSCLANSCTSGYSGPSTIFNYLQNNYCVEDFCLPYSCPPVPCIPSFTCSEDKIKMHYSKNLSPTNNLGVNEELLKENLIKYGPIYCVIDQPSPSLDHAMVLFGYSTAKTGDTIYKGTGENDPPIVLDDNCPFLGQIHFYFKDSDKSDNFRDWLGPLGPFIYGYQSGFFYDQIFRITNLVSNTPIICSDEDHDGYYWWGIHWEEDPVTGLLVQTDPSDCGCPPGVIAEEEDCNDDDPTVKFYAADYSCTPNDCATLPGVLPLTSNTNWPNDMHINQIVVIESGGTLTVNKQVFFTPGARIIVKPNAKLILQGPNINGVQYQARLSSSCTEPWGGVELWGDPTLPQTEINQGTIIINHGIIENALCGIKTIIPGWNPDGLGGGNGIPLYDGLPTGGVVQATNATFRNNYIGVEFFPYKQKDGNNYPIDNVSYFKNCTFTIDSECLEDIIPNYLLKFDGTNRIKIRGCTFQNLKDEISDNRGIGLYSINSVIDIDNYINGFSFPTYFNDLTRGIYAIHTGSRTASVSLKRAEFNGNDFGSYFTGYTGVNPVIIDSNKYIFDHNYSNATKKYGLYLDNCSGYKVQQNDFKKTGIFSGVDLIGTVVNNSGNATNYIYDNTYDNLSIGLEGLNINLAIIDPDGSGIPSSTGGTGLHSLCNNFNNMNVTNTSKILVAQTISAPATGIGLFQQNIGNVPDDQKPAGNDFYYNAENNNEAYDVNMDGNNVQNIQYLFHQYVTGNVRTNPINIYNPSKVSKQALLGSHYNQKEDPIPSCPNDFPVLDKVQMRNNLLIAEDKIDSLFILIESLIDGGSTENLITTINYSIPSQSDTVYQDLIIPSPYLSDTVLKTSIQKEDVLPNDLIKNIMVANPQSAKNDDLLEELSKRSTPMPDSMMMEILDGRDTVGELEILKGILTGWIQARDFYYKSLIDVYLADTTGSSGDSLIMLLSNTPRLESKYMLFTYYCDLQNFDDADAVLDNIPLSFQLTYDEQDTYNKMVSLLPLLIAFTNDSCGNNMPDSLQILELEELAAYDYTLPGAFARNILSVCGLFDYQEPIVTETTLKLLQLPITGITSFKSDFIVFPNPCKDYIIVKCRTKVVDFKIDLLDRLGNKISNFKSENKRDQLIISTERISSGIYFLKIYVDGIYNETKKIIHVN